MAGAGSNGGESKGRSVPLDDLSPSEELARIKMTDGEIPSASSLAYAVEQPGSASDVSQVLYVKDNVWVWPCRSSRIMGRLQLTLSRDIVYVSWLPYPSGKPQGVRPASGGPGSSSASSSANGQVNSTDPPALTPETSGYAIRPIPITDIEAFRKHTPSIGTHHVAIVMRDGSVHPPLHFFNGGIKAMIAVLREHVNLTKSATDCNTYVVASAESAPQLPPSLDTHGSADSIIGDPLGPQGGDNSSESPPVTGDLSNGGPSMLAARTSSGNGPPPLRASDFETSATSVSAPPTAASVFTQPSEPCGATQSSGMANNDHMAFLGRSFEALADRSVKGLARFLFPEHAENIAQAKEELSMNTAMADLYSKGPLGRARRLRIASACNGRQSAPQNSAANSNGKALGKPPKAASTAVGSFELVSEDAAPASSSSLSTPLTPLAADEWATFLDPRGRISDPPALWERVYRGGVTTGLRKEVWKFLLGVYDIDSTAVDRVERMRTLREQYRNIRWQWQAITDDQAAHWAKWRERRNQVEKDVVRTDRDHPLFSAQDAPALGVMHRVLLSYVMYNQDLGYSQGMSDLLSVVLLVTTDETEAFWIFERLMHRVGGNFDKDQACCQAQLKGLSRLVQLLDPPLHAAIRAAGATDYLFAFRWIMVLLKREFLLAEVPALWEALWTNTFSPQLHLYVALALLQYKRHDILSTGGELHSGHMHSLCGNLRGTVGLSEALQDAEALVMYAGAAGLTCLSEVPLPRLPVTGDILGEAGQANAAPGALEELIGGGGSDSGADEDEESDESPSATQHTTSASPDDSVREPLPYQGSHLKITRMALKAWRPTASHTPRASLAE